MSSQIPGDATPQSRSHGCQHIAVRRGPDTGLGELAKVGASLSFVMIATHVFAVWAMTTTPS
jgi:hypothetical protein